MSITIVVGGQAGSEAKGAVCARLQRERKYDWAVRVGGPNAGHTAYDDAGRRWALRQLPVAAVVDADANLVIAAGSEVDLDVLHAEVEAVERAGHLVRDRLRIDMEATVVDDLAKDLEREITTGTTGKGIGGVRAARALRAAERMADLSGVEGGVVDTQMLLRWALESDASVLIEGTQGYILGSHAGFYPYCTSGDCRATDALAATGLTLKDAADAEVWLVLRTYPIRIAGNSGPLEGETTWEKLGLEPEITTVTKKVRRVGEWSWDWARASVHANAPTAIALTFADYWWPELANADGIMPRADLPPEIEERLTKTELMLQTPIRMLGTGPTSQLMLVKEGASAKA